MEIAARTQHAHYEQAYLTVGTITIPQTMDIPTRAVYSGSEQRECPSVEVLVEQNDAVATSNNLLVAHTLNVVNNNNCR